MGRLRELWRRVAFFFRRGRFHSELEEEMLQHLEMRAQAFVASGRQAHEARYAARREFGNPLRLRERS